MKIQTYAKTLLNVFQYVHIMLIVKCRWFDLQMVLKAVKLLTSHVCFSVWD